MQFSSGDDTIYIDKTQTTNKPGRKTMTKTEATTLQAKIEGLRQSALNQINREFEGQSPDYDLPQQVEANELEDELNDSGFVKYNGRLWSASEIQGLRETFNGCVRSFQSANPGQKVPSASVKSWEAQIGMSLGTIKAIVSTLGL